MVAYLKKPKGSEEFHQIVDFLNASHIRYALTEYPTIHVSLIKQFWETATSKTLDNGEFELTATIDGKVKIVTETSVRRHLQLADSDGISSLPNTKIFEQLSLMGSPTPSPVADEAASTGVDVRYGGDTTTFIGLEVGQGIGNIYKTPTMLHDSPLPRVNTLGSNKGSMTLQELMVLCTTLSKMIAGIDQDPSISLVQHDAEIQGRHKHDMEFDFDLDAAKDVSTAKPVSTVSAAVTTASIAAVSTASPTRRVSTADDITMAETLVYIRKSSAKDKGKGKMDESEPVQTKTKLQQEQERLGYEAVVRLQAELEEEERQRIVRVHEAASSFNAEEWEDIQARVKADEELA
ncbi:hypothetical protein Tco_1318712 [Tanacetum coccineum]